MAKLLKIAVITWLVFSLGSSGQTGSGTVTITTLSIPQSIQFSPNGEIIYLGTVYSDPIEEDGFKRENTIESHDSKAGNLIKKYKFDCKIKCYNAPFVISESGNEIYISFGAEKNIFIQKINVITGKTQEIKNESIKLIYAASGISISNDSKYLVMGGYYIYIYIILLKILFLVNKLSTKVVALIVLPILNLVTIVVLLPP